MFKGKALPVYVSWTKGIESWEAETMVAGMRTMLSFASLKPKVEILGFKESFGDYRSPDWYQDNYLISSLGKQIQIDAGKLWIAIQQETWRWKNPHIAFMIFDKDMTKQIVYPDGKRGWLNFIFGQGGKDLGTTISVYRFRQLIQDKEQYCLVLRMIAAHEFGHILGLVSRQTETADRRGGLYENHCSNLCVMHQVMGVKEALRLALDLEKDGVFLCPDCQKELMNT